MPLFNGASTPGKLNQIKKYLDNFKPDSKNNDLGGLHKIKYKSHFLIIDTDKPLRKSFQNHTNQALYPSNIF